MQRNSYAFSPPTIEQLEIIKRFETAYNAIDRKLRSNLGEKEEVSFTEVVKKYVSTHQGWREKGNILRELGSLRNTLVHNETLPGRYLAVPLLEVVIQIEHIRDDLIRPLLVVPKFQRPVVSIELSTSLSEALRLMYKDNYSQLPVYDGNSFRGVLTENGIARWLARYVSNKDEIVDLSDVPVKHGLKQEEKRPDFLFVAHQTLVDDVVEKYASNPELEVVLITANGKSTEKLLGIITAWDIAHLD